MHCLSFSNIALQNSTASVFPYDTELDNQKISSILKKTTTEGFKLYTECLFYHTKAGKRSATFNFMWTTTSSIRSVYARLYRITSDAALMQHFVSEYLKYLASIIVNYETAQSKSILDEKAKKTQNNLQARYNLLIEFMRYCDRAEQGSVKQNLKDQIKVFEKVFNRSSTSAQLTDAYNTILKLNLFDQNQFPGAKKLFETFVDFMKGSGLDTTARKSSVVSGPKDATGRYDESFDFAASYDLPDDEAEGIAGIADQSASSSYGRNRALEKIQAAAYSVLDDSYELSQLSKEDIETLVKELVDLTTGNKSVRQLENFEPDDAMQLLDAIKSKLQKTVV